MLLETSIANLQPPTVIFVQFLLTICTSPLVRGINKNSGSHFRPVRVRILWLLAAATGCLSFSLASTRYCASLFPSLPFPILSHFQLTQARSYFPDSYSASVKGTVANRMLLVVELDEAPITILPFCHRNPHKRAIRA